MLRQPMDSRAAKLALARKKLKDHQEKKTVGTKEDGSEEPYFDNVIESTCSEPEKNEHKLVEEKYEDIRAQKPDVPDVNVTEILVSNKRNLEIQVTDLLSKLSQFENNEARLINDNIAYKHRLTVLEQELKNVTDNYQLLSQDLASKNSYIEELSVLKAKLLDENSNFCEQLELTKSMLTEKESENSTLINQLNDLQNKLDTTQLQLQQLTNGTKEPVTAEIINKDSEINTEMLLQKISIMEQQLNKFQKDKDNMAVHYEHYVGELNEQLKSMVLKNQKCVSEIQVLSNREKELIDHISELEIRLQNYKLQCDFAKEQTQKVVVSDEKNDMEQKYNNIQEKFLELNDRYNDLQKKYAETESKLEQTRQGNKSEFDNENISFSKLQADITSDKVAVQRATEQNKKLKSDLQNLEEAFVKMSKDKLELTEKLDAEKFLNRELTIRLAEMEEKIKDMFNKLGAKDEEMIRLQSCLRKAETLYDKKMEEEKTPTKDTGYAINEVSEEKIDTTENNKENECKTDGENIIENSIDNSHQIDDSSQQNFEEKLKIPKPDAMLKLQERFLKIMEEVADLSDEKHRLEHIILQLQNETETICEYVSLYQQQRSLLKRRDEERNAQIKIFQAECKLLERHLEELSSILVRITQDKELSTYFQTESRQKDAITIMNLLQKLKSNSIVDSRNTCSELNDFYPCSCCSGQLIDV